MKIALGSDHAGYNLKEKMKEYLASQNNEVKDFGTYSSDSCDYPDFAKPVAESVAKKEYDRGIVVCGSGVGVSITANKVPGIRAVIAYNEEIAKQSREHGDCNVLALGEKYMDFESAKKIVDIWLKTPFSNDPRHIRRINKIER